MRLFLASRVHFPSTIKELDDYVGGLKGKKIAYIPTASNGEDGWEFWKTKIGGTWEFVNTLGASVEVVVLEDYRDGAVINQLKEKDIVWFAGGMAGYLAYWMRRCSLDTLLPKVLSDKILYVGSSAGAMVAGQSLQISGLKMVDGERGSEGIKPMGFVNFDILPHYEEKYLSAIKENYKNGKLYLLKDGEEIIVEGDKIKLVGEERIINKS